MQARLRTDIQGLRALAVCAVVLNHAFPEYATGGYVGVDIFFVISGFLISRNIVRDLEYGRFSLLQFYRKRLRRILPALGTVLVATLVAGCFLLSPTGYEELADTAIATIFFVSNFAFYNLTGYFDGAAEFKPLLHMWSLAVEEQFYIVFPPFLLLFWKRLGRFRSTLVIGAAAIASLLLAEMLLRLSPNAAYYMLPPRAAELLIGVILGIGPLPAARSPIVRSAAAIAGSALILAAILTFTSQTPFPGLAALVPCLGTALLIYSGNGTDQTAIGRLLSLAPAVYVGAISYSLYLWHWPVLAYFRVAMGADLSPQSASAAILAAFVLACLTYHVVERPFLSGRSPCLRYPALAGAQHGMALAASAAIIMTSGLPMRYSPNALKLIAAKNDYNPRRRGCHYDGISRVPTYDSACLYGAAKATADLAIWGDSHGAELSIYLGRRAADAGRSIRALTSSLCPPAQAFAPPNRPRCMERNSQVLRDLASDPAIKTVVLVANGQLYRDPALLEQGLRQSIDGLLAAGKQIVIIKQTPTMDFDPPAQAGLATAYGLSKSSLGAKTETVFAAAKTYDETIDRLARNDKVTTFDPKPALCDRQTCHAYHPASGVLYFNQTHMSLTGVAMAFRSLADALYRKHASAPLR